MNKNFMDNKFSKIINLFFFVIVLTNTQNSYLFAKTIEDENKSATRLFLQLKKSTCSNQLKQTQLGDFIINYPQKKESYLQEDVNKIFTSNSDFFKSDNQSPLIFICGNELGLSTLYYKLQYPYSTVVVFEEDDESFLSLKRNIFANNLENVTPNKCVLGKEVKNISIPYTKEDPAFEAICREAKRDLVIYDTKSIDKLSNYINQSVDCLKLNIKGKELEIIEELEQSSKLSLIKKIIITFHHNVNHENSLAKLLSILEKNQFDYALEKSSYISFFDRDSSDIKNKEQSFYVYASKKS